MSTKALRKKPRPSSSLHLAGSSEWLHFDVGKNVYVCYGKKKEVQALLFVRSVNSFETSSESFVVSYSLNKKRGSNC